jgi:predicted SAM-dependent methyltransferase
MKKLKKILYILFTIVDRQRVLFNWKQWTNENKTIKIIIGASKTNYKGWFQTEQYVLDLTNRGDFTRMFSKHKINFILAEHVLEHLTNSDLELMLKNFLEFSSEDINIRIAVPDGFHKSAEYIDNVKPSGIGPGCDDHKNLFTYISLSNLFEKAGFKAHPIEYWDEKGTFHRGYTNDEKGYINRSFINDRRNRSGEPVYTSLIIDFTKQ